MRTFIAITLPEDIRDSLEKVQKQLKTSQADVKWVEPKNIHLTLKFLGEIDNSQLEKIIAILGDTAKNQAAFLCRISSVGAFPRDNSPRVIWAGIDLGDEEIKQIAKRLETNLLGLGFPPEDKPFSSHITLGRTKSSLNRDSLVKGLLDLQKKAEKETIAFSVNKITLFKSTLTPLGPIYEPLKEVILTMS